MKGALLVFALSVWVAACATRADGPPEIVIDRTACSQCGMLVSEPTYAAAVRTADGAERVFDDIGCLLNAVPARSAAGARFWFHDTVSGGWIDGSAAVFVRSDSLHTPMGGGTVAFADRAAAADAAARYRGSVVASLAALITEKGGRP